MIKFYQCSLKQFLDIQIIISSRKKHQFRLILQKLTLLKQGKIIGLMKNNI